MKKTSLTLLAALAAVTAIAGPALAQPYGPPPAGAYRHDDGAPGGYRHDDGPQGGYRHDDRQPGGWEIDRRIEWIQERIRHGRDDGSLGRQEFFRVQRELNSIRREENMDRRRDGGRLDGRVREDLQNRLDRLNDQIRWLRQGAERHPW